MRNLFAIIAVAALAMPVSAAKYVETWEGLSGGNAAPITGTPSLPGWNLVYDNTAPRSEIITDGFPGLGGTKALKVPGSSFDWVQLDSSGATNTLPLSNNTLQYAFALKVNSLDPADSDIDIMTVDATAGTYNPMFGVRAATNVFRSISPDGGWPGATTPFSTTAFDPASSSSYVGTGWRVIAVRAPMTVAGGQTYGVWDITSSSTTRLFNAPGAAVATPPTSVGRFAAGLCIAGSPRSTATTEIVIDDVVFFDNAFSSESEFVNNVKLHFGLLTANVTDWALYDM
jgi:hypothetical protein